MLKRSLHQSVTGTTYRNCSRSPHQRYKVILIGRPLNQKINDPANPARLHPPNLLISFPHSQNPVPTDTDCLFGLHSYFTNFWYTQHPITCATTRVPMSWESLWNLIFFWKIYLCSGTANSMAYQGLKQWLGKWSTG